MPWYDMIQDDIMCYLLCAPKFCFSFCENRKFHTAPRLLKISYLLCSLQFFHENLKFNTIPRAVKIDSLLLPSQSFARTLNLTRPLGC